MGLELLVFLTNFQSFKLILMFALLGVFICLYLPIDGEKLYLQLGHWLRFLFSKKHYEKHAADPKSDISAVVPFVGFSEDLIDYGSYFAGVMEIMPKEFRLLSAYKQSEIIDKMFASVLKSISGKTRASIVKIDRPILFDSYIADEQAKKPALDKIEASGGIGYHEVTVRKNLIDDRTEVLKNLNENARIYRSAYYLVIYDENPATIAELLRNASEKCDEYAIRTHRLTQKELVVFLKYNYTNAFDEREIDYYEPDEYMDYILPDTIDFHFKKTVIDGRDAYTYTVRSYPLTVKNAWGFQMFNIEGTKVVISSEVDGWAEITIADGKKGWTELSHLERI